MTNAVILGSVGQSGVMARLTGMWLSFKSARNRRRTYVETRRALAALSTRELDDLGIARSEISQAAFAAAYEM